jgi:hypothetical protein
MESKSIQPIGKLHESEQGYESNGCAVGQKLKRGVFEPGPVDKEVISKVSDVENYEHDCDQIDESSIFLGWRFP